MAADVNRNTPGTQTGPQVIVQEETTEYTLLAELNSDETECIITCHKKDPPITLKADMLFNILIEAGIKSEFISLDAVNTFCVDLRDGKNPGRTVAARGYRPPPGTDGRIEIDVSTTTDEAHYVIDEQGRIDYRSRHAIANVSPGQKVAVIIPPQNGPPGSTVRGQMIPPRSGAPFDFHAGRGVLFEKDTGTVTVDTPGRLLLEGQTLSVTDEFVVAGDVNYGVGHIKFSGFVHIKGDVLDEFRVEATKGMQIDGVAGRCQLVAGGDIKIASMFGKGGGTIRCTGNLQANMLIGANVECRGNVKVNGEIRDSVIKALGSITAKVVCGGELVALRGVEANTIGAKCGTSTQIAAGQNFFDPDRLKSLQNQLLTVEKQIERTHQSIAALSRQLKDEDDTLNIRLKTRKQELNEFEMTQEIVTEELRFYQPGKAAEANPRINVIEIVYEGVNILVDDIGDEIHTHIQGPVSIIKNPFGSGLRKLSLTPLHISADKLIAEIAAREGKTSAPAV
jgi:uncharacterized protein (DUF342 family)